MKDAMITYLKTYNKTVEPESIITRLHYSNHGVDQFVEDFSYFTNDKYMSEELLSALRNGQTLTSALERELDCFIKERVSSNKKNVEYK